MAEAVSKQLERPRTFASLAVETVLEFGTIAVLAVLPFLFFWRLFTAAPYDLASIVPGDFTDLHYPNRVFAARELLSGTFPLWNPYVSSGHSALGDIQVGIFYPLNVALALLLGRDGAFSFADLEAQVVVHFSLAAIFTYLFVRRLTCSRLAATTSSLIFTFGGYLTSYPVQQIIILEVSVWLPLILLLLDLAVERRRFLYFVLAGIGASLAILVGHPQTFVYVAIVCGVFLCYRIWTGGRPLRFSLPGTVVFVVVALGLASIQLLPSYEHLGLTARTEVGYEFVRSGFEPREMVGLLLPTVAGGKALYVGILPLLLAGWALFRGASRGRVWFWFGLAVVGLVMSFGGNTFFHSLEYVLVPGMKFFRNHERTALIFSFATAVLAGYGVKDLLGSRPARELSHYSSFIRWSRWGFLCLAVVSLLFHFASATAAESVRNVANELANRSLLTALLLFLSIAIIHLRLRVGFTPVLAGTLVVLLVGLDLFTTNWQNNLRLVPPDSVLPRTELVRLVQGGLGQYRVASEGLLPGDGNTGSAYGFQDVVGNSPLELERYQLFEKNVEEWQRWQLLNVRYILTRRQFNDGRFIQVGKAGDVFAYEIQEAHRLPRATVVHRATVATSDREAFDLIKKANLREEVILARAPGLALSDRTPSASWARVDGYSPDRIKISAGLPDNGILVLSEVNYPGWRVFVDGAPAEVIQANYLLRAVPLSAGTHVVEFVYDPDSLAKGKLLTILAAILAVLVVLAEGAVRLARRLRRREVEQAASEERGA